ncbi:MAG TPA: serine hydrolase domain-containing protein [Methylomirabilota bacterium]|nr:serine hydrolase domain-containing protein [Methylomirabilota bacterium]
MRRIFAGALMGCAAVTAQELKIQRTVELSFLASGKQSHILESSGDLAHWAALGGAMVAESGTVARTTLLAETNQFFRVRSVEIRDLRETLEPIRARFKTPALACAVVKSNAVVALGFTGNRKWNVNEPVTPEDKWHHGSLTKSMTATLAGVLVDEGKLTWTTTVGSIFPEMTGMHERWKNVTLEQLLCHRAGAPGDLNANGLWDELWNHGGTPREQRALLVRRVTAAAPIRTPGTGYTYSNAGYAIAGAMMEKIEGVPWEELITRKLLARVGMESAGFGVPATPRYINHPWGHAFQNGSPSPIEPGRSADNPPAIGPGGTVHCTLVDMAEYAAFHLQGARGEGKLLKGETYEKLYADVAGQGYALGWGVTDRPWAGGKALNHTGSNTQWYTNVWIAQGKNVAFVIVTNIGGDPAFQCTDAVAAKLIELYL